MLEQAGEPAVPVRHRLPAQPGWENQMIIRKRSALIAFVEYLGRGATPLDGFHWTHVRRQSGSPTKPEAEERAGVQSRGSWRAQSDATGGVSTER